MNIAAFFSRTQHNAEQRAAEFRQSARQHRDAADLAIGRGDTKAADRYHAKARWCDRAAVDSEESAADFKHLGSRLEVIP